jgi:hypothetical protein
MATLDPQWLARLQAIGRAQARYLWVLLVAMLFYAALQSQVPAEGSPQALEVPLVHLQLKPEAVAASGPAVLAFLLLVFNGALRAFDNARAELKLGEGLDSQLEPLDLHPNAIDLAIYTTSLSPPRIARSVYFAYPVFLSMALLEAGWLWYRLLRSTPTLATYLFLAIGLLLWLPACWQLTVMWTLRIAKVRQ